MPRLRLLPNERALDVAPEDTLLDASRRAVVPLLV